MVAGGAEGVVGVRRQCFPYETGGGILAQRGRPNHGCERVRDDLPYQARVLSRLARSEADDDHEAQSLHPRQDVREPAQRGQVAPVQVVDGEQERAPRGDVRRQPVEAVQCRQRRFRVRLRSKPSGVEDRRGERGGSAEQLGSLLSGQPGNKRLEELSYDAIGECALELGAARAQHLHPRFLGSRSCLHDQRRLADPGRPLDRQKPVALKDGADHSVDGR
jgi:hypothetical protein